MLQFLRPTKGTQVVASDVLKFLASNKSYERIALHGLSVGGYVWGECLVQLRENEKFHPIEKRIKSQVWDSIASIEGIGQGIASAMFGRNLTLQKLVKRFIAFYLERFEQTVTKHYIKSDSFFNHQAIDAPALMFFSQTDKIGSMATNNGIAENLRSSGRRLTTKVFEDSPHVGHLKKHRDVYLRCLMDHLESCDLIGEKK